MHHRLAALLLAAAPLAAAALGYTAKLAADTLRRDGAAALAVRTLLAATLVSCFFEVLPRHPVGVSEVHFILGSPLLPLFGAAPAHHHRPWPCTPSS